MTKMPCKTNQKTAVPANEICWYQLTPQRTLSYFHSRAEGLTREEAMQRLESQGPNALPEKAGKPAWLRFIHHVNDVLIYILLAAAVLTATMGHWVDTLVILAVVLINAMIGYVQENNAEKSLKSIRNMLTSETVVVRHGRHETIPTVELVPGDIVVLRAGDRIPADMRILEAHNLRVEEAILTGESLVVDKTASVLTGELPLGDRTNMLFSGTTVSAGSATGIVVATGADTELGHINQMVSGVEKHRTPLLVQMDKLGKAIFVIVLGMMAALFIFSIALRDIGLSELALSLISLAVAAVPEGLPAIISIILSLGVQAMARQKAIIRKLPTVETLGAMTVICSDKTGTLTMNEMTVKTVVMADQHYRVEGDSYEPVGLIFPFGSETPTVIAPETPLARYLRTIDVCNDSQLIQSESGLWTITGGPTEGAQKVLAAKGRLPAADITIRSKIPFDSQYKYMAMDTVIDGQHFILVTGAPDVLFRLCLHQLTENGVVPFDNAYWEAQVIRYAGEGLRMVAAAWMPGSDQPLTHNMLQGGLTFLGMSGMMDPPRPEAVDAVQTCQQAGIAVKMITGDHPQTAMSIGAMLGIHNSHLAVTGAELEHMDDATLRKVAAEFPIFARTSPEHKLRLVQALQSQGEVVGMTGDGVNDAPALRQADVGIAMGIKGTEVTKEAADMVLTNDNFSTITAAVREGRRVYDNLKKTILFIMPTNLAQGLLIIVALLAGKMIPLTPVLILWLNMVTSATLSFGLAFEAGEKSIMCRPPRKTGQHVMDLYAVWRVVFVGSMIALGAFALESWLQSRGNSPEIIRSALLQMLVAAQWFYMINCRVNNGFSVSKCLLKNKGLWVVSGILLLLQIGIIYLPFMQSIFGTAALSPVYWLLTFVIGAVMFAVVELEKVVTRRWRKI